MNIFIIIILGIVYIKSKNLKILFNFSNLSLFIFFLIMILSSWLNISLIGIENFFKSIFLLKFFLLYVIIETLLFYKIIRLKYFFYVCLILSIFVSLDLLVQYFNGKNLLGLEPWQGRITGVFGAEAIAGAFLQKTFIFSVIAFFFLFNDNSNKIITNKKLELTQPLIFTLIILATFVANNRISFLILISFVVILIFFFKTLRKNLFFSLLIIVPIIGILINSDPQLNKRYSKLINQAGKILQIEYFKIENNSQSINQQSISEKKYVNKNFPDHRKIFNTSFLSFKDKMFYGNGFKSFRYNCKNYLNINNTLCSTHPHNYHLEILNDVGIVGFSTMFIFVLSLLLKVRKTFFSKNLNKNEKIILALIVLNFLIEIFPIKSTGSIFTTWNGTILWFSVALMNYQNIEKSINKRK